VNCLGRHFAGKIDFRFYFFKELIWIQFSKIKCHVYQQT
jgi:hypothetical protein